MNQKTRACAVKKKYWKRIIIITGALLTLIFSYFTFVVIKARLDTPGMVKKALSANGVTLKVRDLNQWQLNVLLKVEDPNFFHHHGIDLKTPGAGLTTITQAVVKKLYFDHFQPGIAKIKQSLIARFAVDPLVSKETQLKIFINYMYFGSVNGKSIIGLDQAAHAYYHKSVPELTADQYLSIIAMIAAPENFHILNRPEANAERTARIKKVVSGAYQPKSLMDIFYGKLDPKTQSGLAPASYFPAIYED
ncbi:MAG TPA: transglycosylase domain-containing protein [Bacillota bacterium]|nr:transglycosylase domain-containing protein [Bacillota bacterium]